MEKIIRCINQSVTRKDASMEARIMNRSLARATVEAPSQSEVDRAIYELQASDNWIHRLLNLTGQARVYNVFLMLRKEPIVRMVVSVVTDEAVWNAIRGNKEVSAFLNAFSGFASIGEEKAKGNGEKRDFITLLIDWVIGIGNAIILDFIERLNSFLNKATGTSNNNNKKQHPSSDEELNYTLRAMYFLSFLVYLLVFVTRANGL